MNEFDKQRVENALWVLSKYEMDLIDIAESSENIFSMDFRDALCKVLAIKEEL